MTNYPSSVTYHPALWPDNLPTFDGMRFYAVTLAPNGHILHKNRRSREKRFFN